MTRREAIGIELTASVMRGVLVHPALPDLVVAADEIPVRGLDDDALLEQFTRLQLDLGGRAVPTRIAWAGSADSLQAADVTAMSRDGLRALRRRFHDERDVATTMLVEHRSRRWLIAIDWDDSVVERIRRSATSAGFDDVSVESAPIAIARVLSDGHVAVHRTADPTTSWDLVAHDGLPLAATPGPPSDADADGPVLDARAIEHRIILPEPFASVREIADFVRAAHRDRIDGDRVPPRVDGRVLTDAPRHDVRALDRIATAVGAATAAAGMATAVRVLDLSTPAHGDAITRRPWTIAPLPLEDEPTEPTGSWFRRRRVPSSE